MAARTVNNIDKIQILLLGDSGKCNVESFLLHMIHSLRSSYAHESELIIQQRIILFYMYDLKLNYSFLYFHYHSYAPSLISLSLIYAFVGAGKSSLVLQFAEHTFEEKFEPTIG